jgi:hypothetical protein
MSLKNPVTPPGIDPGTIQLVAQRLNHYVNPGPNAIRACTEVEGQLYVFLTSVLDGGEWSDLHSGHFIPVRESPLPNEQEAE